MATAPDPAPTKQKEELVRCSICQETLGELQSLGCIHSFCLQCLAQHVECQSEEAEGETEYLCSCPLCRTQFRLKKGERVIRNLLELLDVQRRTQQLVCECCSQVPAGCRCIDCERLMCTNCLTTHKNKCEAKHETRCEKPNHGNKVIEFYCNTCKEIACIKCIVLNHTKPDHEYEDIAVVAERRKDALKETSAILEEKSKQSRYALQEIECTTQFLEANAKVSKERILQQEKEIRKEFTRKLKCKTAALMSNVDKKHKDVKQKLGKQQNEMKARTWRR